MTESIALLMHKAKLVAARLERLSADSSYAHQASGLRGAILRAIARFGRGRDLGNPDEEWLGCLVSQGYNILIKAAAKIPES